MCIRDRNVTELCGSAPQLIDELYKSETATHFNNRSIAWLLKLVAVSDLYSSSDVYKRQRDKGDCTPSGIDFHIVVY